MTPLNFGQRNNAFELLEKTLESPFDSKEIKPVNPKGNQSWIFIGMTDAEAKLQYFIHLKGTAHSLENILRLGKIEGRRKVKVKVNSCPTLCYPVDCGLPGSSVHRILQARTLEWVAISFSRGSSQPRDWVQVSYFGGRCFNLWATRGAYLKVGEEGDNRWWDGWMASQLNGSESEQALGDGEGQKSLACYSPLGLKESNRTELERLNNIKSMQSEF